MSVTSGTRSDSREGDPLVGETPQRDAAQDAVLLRDPLTLDERLELLLGLRVGHGRGQPDAEPFLAGDGDARPRLLPGSLSAVPVVERGGGTVQADLEDDAVARELRGGRAGACQRRGARW